MKMYSIDEFVKARNAEKVLFTAGPAALLSENITGLRPCFGRDDDDYLAVESRVMNALRRISGHQNVARMQGSASLALEIMALNYLFGRVLIVDSGYYSQRLNWLACSSMRQSAQIKEILITNWNDLENLEGKFDWIFACYTETSCGLKIPIESLRSAADRHCSKLMLDATASIGLESNHELADVIAYSSCKGLFGLTGAAFIAFNDAPTVEVDSFYMNLKNHIDKLMTGPYHTIASLDHVLEKHEAFRMAVMENKKRFSKDMENYLTLPELNQPLLCTHVRCTIATNDERAILYRPRSDAAGSVVCHLGEVHLGSKANGDILSALEISK